MFFDISYLKNFITVKNISLLIFQFALPICRLQAQSALAEAAAASGVALPKGPIDVAKHVVREAGMKGLFKGLVPTMGREVPGNAVMFGVYEGTKQYLAGGQDTSNLGRGSLILSGGLAGAVFWLSVYPTDVVKSVIQVDDYKKPRYSGSVDAFKKILAADGVKGLYKGFGPAMARSVPANAATFLAYEITRSALGWLIAGSNGHIYLLSWLKQQPGCAVEGGKKQQ